MFFPFSCVVLLVDCVRVVLVFGFVLDVKASTLLGLRERHRCFMPLHVTKRDVACLLSSSLELASLSRFLHGTP